MRQKEIFLTRFNKNMFKVLDFFFSLLQFLDFQPRIRCIVGRNFWQELIFIFCVSVPLILKSPYSLDLRRDLDLTWLSFLYFMYYLLSDL